MDQKSTQAPILEPNSDKPQARDANAEAKKAFQAALEKTKEQTGETEKPVQPVAKKEIKKPEPSEIELLRREIAELKASKSKETKKEEPAKPSDFDSVQAQLAEEFGEEEGAILGKTLRALLEPREKRIEHLEKLIEKAVDQNKHQIAKSNRGRLSKEYQHLGESDEAWKIVEAQAAALFSNGGHETPEEAFDAVAQALYGAMRAKAEESAEQEASRIAASIPTQPNSAKRDRKMTREQKVKAVFDHLWKNPEDKAGASRLARELKVDE